MKKIFSSITILAMIISTAGAFPISAVAQDHNPNNNDDQNSKVNICHATSSENNPWNAIQIDSSALQTHLDGGDFLYNGPVDHDGKPTHDGDDWCGHNVPPPPPVDACPNQETDPGIQDHGPCNSDDVCPNEQGIQTEVPNGEEIVAGECVPIVHECTATNVEQDIVSDTTNTVSGPDSIGNAVATYVHPSWASISGATWIWDSAEVTDPTTEQTSIFTKTFTITGTPISGSIELATDNGYTLKINGNVVSPDQIAVENNFSSTVTFDVTSLLQSGTNTIEVTVKNFAVDGSDSHSNPAGLLYKLTVHENDCQTPPPPPTDVCPNLDGDQATIPDGYQLVDGHCVPIPPTTVTINATKIVCPAESDLPNWGDHSGPDITATTASDFLTSHPQCHEAPWTFEWAPSNASNPGDNVGVGGGDWTPFTGGTVTIPTPTNPPYVWVREQMQDGYVPFSGATSRLTDTDSENSAEMYCNVDHLNYDNLDRVDNMTAGNTYYCVAFNATVPPPPPVCDANQELIANGSFETPTVSASSWNIFPSGTTGLGWFVDWFNGATTFNSATRPEVANAELQSNGLNSWTASNGFQWTELDSDWDGPTGSLNGEPASVALSQNITTVPGTEYKLSFDFSPRPGTDAGENIIEALYGGVLGVTAGPTAGGGNTSWAPYSFDFVATTTSTMITLRDAGAPSDSLGPFLDNVSLRCVPPTENPSTVKVTIEKFIDADGLSHASAENTNSASFPMTSTWNALNIGSGSGNFTLGPVGFNNPTPYNATTADMTSGADYGVVENLGSVCNADNQGQYILEGYKVGDSESSALSGSLVDSASLTDITSDKFIIVVNKLCGEVEGASTLKVHIYKYLDDGETIAQVPDDSDAPSFPMTATWQTANLNGGVSTSGTYVLGDNHGGATLKYAADTAPMEAPADYTTSEVTDGSVVVANQDSCSVGKYYLEGYKSGDDLSSALASSTSLTAPVFVGLNSDQTVVVINKQCPTGDDVVNPPTDVCPNISGDQAEVPNGDHINGNGECVPNDDIHNDTPTNNNGGGGGNGPIGFGLVNGGGNGSNGQVLGESCGVYMDKYIRFGSKKNDSDQVKKLQEFLNQELGLNLPITGFYGSLTNSAVKNFQEKYPDEILKPWGLFNGTGLVYLSTLRQINNIECPGLSSELPPLIPWSQNPNVQ